VVRVKVCGVTREADARLLEALGVHAVGLVFAPSPRRLTLERAAAVAGALGPLVHRVGVFANATEAEILAAVRAARLSAVQLHGDEPPELAERIRARVPVIKAFRVGGAVEPGWFAYPADAILLDGPRPGSGQAFDWSWLDAVPAGARVVVAGGLSPENVCGLLQRFRPYAVDVSSGVESSPGVKDRARVEAFLRAVEGCG
jgi:phosphoribosylanthranilate isomerase